MFKANRNLMILGLLASILSACGADDSLNPEIFEKPLLPEFCEDRTFTVCQDGALCPQETITVEYDVDCLSFAEIIQELEKED